MFSGRRVGGRHRGRVAPLALCAVVTLGAPACEGLLSSQPSEEDVTRLACIRVLRWNHDPSSQSEVLSSTIQDWEEFGEEGWTDAERTMENLVRMFQSNDTFALSNWETSEPCQDAEREVREKYDLPDN